MYGAPTRKPTQVLYGNSDFSPLEAHCNHEGVEQQDEHGRVYIAPHPSYVGKKDKDGLYLTRSLAAYPAELSCKLATLINSSVLSRGSSSCWLSTSPYGRPQGSTLDPLPVVDLLEANGIDLLHP